MTTKTPIKRALLVGTPNSGKSTIFNKLTKANQKTGNWSGVTVSAKTIKINNNLELVDLPGIHTLSLPQNLSLDEKTTITNLLEGYYDFIINIIDADNLQRSLFLTVQLLELGKPIILLVNKSDLAKSKNIAIDINELANSCFIPKEQVLLTSTKARSCEQDILKVITSQTIIPPLSYQPYAEKELEAAKAIFENIAPTKLTAAALFLKLDNSYCPITISNVQADTVAKQLEVLAQKFPNDVDLIIASERFEMATNLGRRVSSKTNTTPAILQANLDKVLLNRFFGLPIFLAILYLVFSVSITVGGAFAEFFELITVAFLVKLPASLFENHLLQIIFNGIGYGMATVMSFVPVIGGLYLMLSILEESGYLARAAYIMDNYLRKIGLPGKAFIPLIVGFGCNVPGIMATKTINNQNDRITTVMMSPFMSCGARLSVYSVFALAFFEDNAHNIVFSLYIIGVLFAIFTGLIIKRALGSAESPPMLIELHNYQFPSFSLILNSTLAKVRDFIYGVGKIIVIFFLVIQIFGSLPIFKNNQDALDSIARSTTKLFAPMGIEEDNWPAVASIITGALAKEVVLGTLSSLYHSEPSENHGFIETLKLAAESLNLNSDAGDSLSLAIKIKEHFKTPEAAYAYLLFILLYFPCVSVFAAIYSELGKYWATVSAIWSTSLAYCVAVIFYQLTNIINGNHVMTHMLVISFIVPIAFVAYFFRGSKCTLLK